jgi:hypothetical protein
VEHEPELLVCLFSTLLPGEKRITLSYHASHVAVDGFKYESRVLCQLRRLGVFALDAAHCRIEEPTVSAFWCTLRPRRFYASNCVNVLHDNLIENLAPSVEQLDLSGTCEYNPMLSLDGLCALRQCTRLQSLNLSRLSLVDDTVVQCLRDLPELTELNLQGCHRVSSYASLNPRLHSLDLSFCGHIDDLDPNTGGLWPLASMKELQTLDLSRNSHLDQHQFEVLRGMQHLKHLNLASNFHLTNVDRLLPDGLESLSLELCYRVDEASLALAMPRLTHLRFLDLSCAGYVRGNTFEYIPQTVEHLHSLDLSCAGYVRGDTFEHIPQTVEHLSCSFSRRGVSFHHLRHLTRLQTLEASVHRRMDGSTLAKLALETLVSLTLRRCDKFLTSNLHCLLRANRLEHLYLEDAMQLDDAFFIHIVSHLPRLHTLRVRSSNITRAGLRSLSAPRLRTLDLAHSCLLRSSDLQYLPQGVTSLNIFNCCGIQHLELGCMQRLRALHLLVLDKHTQLSLEALRALLHQNPGLRITLDDQD